ncbi:DUF1643 domain-containing protein [Bacillus thuringiensis]|nr:DUF1643 domain-containing protein [Bacillus thuringiensis]
MRIKLHGILNLGESESYVEFQGKFEKWINDNGWGGESVGGIRMPDEMLSQVKIGSNVAVFHPEYKKNGCEKDKNKRYFLSRTWNPKLDIMTVFMMNPSIADELGGDGTVDFMVQVAKYNMCGALLVINTSPIIKGDKTIKSDFPVDNYNNYYINFAIENSDIVILAWGNNGQKFGISNLKEDKHFIELMSKHRKKFKVFDYGSKETKNIYPKHPRPRLQRDHFAIDHQLLDVTEEKWIALFKSI